MISAIGWKGNEREILKGCINGKFNLIESPILLHELFSVLGRPKFDFLSQQDLFRLLRLLVSISDIVLPRIQLNVIKKDDFDNRVLECAVEGQADFIISGDKHILQLNKFQRIRIVNSRTFLKLEP